MATVNYHTLLEDIKTDIKPRLEEVATTGKWESITHWLGKLFLLKGVPFRYLVPDVRMLPPESLKYFQIDQNWLTALIDGAYSIGRTSTKDAPSLSEWLETELYEVLITHLKKEANAYRWSKLHPKKQLSYVYEQDALETGGELILSGFILRSQAVTDFKNMQIVGYDKNNIPTPVANGQALPLIRLEHLAKDVILGIFVGQLYRLDLREPSEGLHYGLDNIISQGARVSSFLKKLRNAEGIEEPDSTLSTPQNLFRNPPDQSTYKPSGAVLNMNQFSKSMFTELQAHPDTQNAVPYASAKTDGAPSIPIITLTSADFALQMTEGAAMVSFLFE